MEMLRFKYTLPTLKHHTARCASDVFSEGMFEAADESVANLIRQQNKCCLSVG